MQLLDTTNLTETPEALAAGFVMSDELRRCLDDLERRIDPVVEEQLLADFRTFLDGNWPEPLFYPTRRAASAPAFEWPTVTVNSAIMDFDRMALQQFAGCSSCLARGAGAPMSIRSNYGVGISSSWFGCDIYLMAEEIETLPTTMPFNDRDKVVAAIGRGIPDVTGGYSARVYAMGLIFRDILAQYPKIGRYVLPYHPDLQSPIDTGELVWGSDLLLAVYEDPDLVHALLDLLTETYIKAVHLWSAIHPFRQDINAHWGLMHKGNIMLRTDSGMNLSPAMYDEFVRPYEERCLAALGGGVIHFCGRGDHFIDSMTTLPGLTGIQMSQPHLNDMELIYRATVDRGIPLLRLDRKAAEADLAAGRDLRHLVLMR